MANTIVVFGSGYKVENLKSVEWFKQMDLFYWGDLDVQGFEILSQFRGYFSHVQSILMDKITFEQFEGEIEKIEQKKNSAPNLTDEERELYELIKENNWRLEQEKISKSYTDHKLAEIMSQKS